MKLYYRGYFTNALHCVAVEGAESVADAIDALKEDLIETGEFYTPPVLGLIQGGKHG